MHQTLFIVVTGTVSVLICHVSRFNVTVQYYYPKYGGLSPTPFGDSLSSLEWMLTTCNWASTIIKWTKWTPLVTCGHAFATFAWPRYSQPQSRTFTSTSRSLLRTMYCRGSYSLKQPNIKRSGYIISFPDPTLSRGKGLVYFERLLLAWHQDSAHEDCKLHVALS